MEDQRRILIIDDDETVRSLVKAVISSEAALEDYEIEEAATVDQGRDIYLARRPSLVITDNNTKSRYTGLRFVKEARDLEASQGGIVTPFGLFCSNVDMIELEKLVYSEAERIGKARLEGGDLKPKFRYFEKSLEGIPFSIRDYALESLGLKQ